MIVPTQYDWFVFEERKINRWNVEGFKLFYFILVKFVMDVRRKLEEEEKKKRMSDVSCF